MLGSSGIIHDLTPDCHPVSWHLKTERIFYSQATCTCVIDVLGLYFDVLSMGVCTTMHWDYRSTGAGIKCFYCMNLHVPCASSRVMLYLHSRRFFVIQWKWRECIAYRAQRISAVIPGKRQHRYIHVGYCTYCWLAISFAKRSVVQ